MAFSYLFLPLAILIPASLIYLEKKVKLIEWLSPAFWCYALGILAGNVGYIQPGLLHSLTDTTVALAIPILLFSANVPQWLRLARPTAISYGLYFLALCSSSLLVGVIGAGWVEAPRMTAAMTATVWTGGTPNMTAVGKMIGASEAVLIPGVTLTDLMLSGILLVFVLSLLHPLLRLFLPPFPRKGTAVEEGENRFLQLPFPQKARLVIASILLGGLCLGIVAGGSLLIWEKINLIFVMIGLTLAGMCISFVPQLRKLPGTYETGEYIFLIFCVAIGATTDIEMFLRQALGLTAFMGSIMLGTLLLHAFLTRLFKIDADTVLITWVSGIFSTPFIGPVANRLNNREIVLSGLTLSAINFALGNFIGLIIWQLLH